MNIKKITSTFILFFSFFVFSKILPVEILISSLLTKETKPTQQFSNLLKKFKINPTISFDEIINQTQKLWLRQNGKERWETSDKFQNEKSELFPIFESLEMISEVKPKKKHYDHVIFLGCSVHRTIKRINFLIKEWEEGLRFDSLVFLLSDRTLDKKVESIDIIETAETEYEATVKIYESIKLPVGFESKAKIVFINTKSKPGQKRPTTKDTIEDWLNTSPTPGNCLFISNQPFVTYQDTVARKILPDTFLIETVGEKSTDKKPSTFLDSIARTIYSYKN